MENKGQFKPGNPGGPGRQKKEREVRFLEITLSAVTFEDWGAIVKKAVAEAKRGDHQARKWLADYLIGVPVQKIAPTTPDGENPYMGLDAAELVNLARKVANVGDDTTK